MEEHITEEKAISLLRKYANSENDFKGVLRHCLAVARIAERVAKKVPGADIDFVRTAAILHDIGRFSFPPGSPDSILHGMKGYEILKKEGLPKHAHLALVHIGIGIHKEDVERFHLNLPKKDMLPSTTEEMIVTYADNLDYFDEEKDERWVEDRYARELGEDYRKKVKQFHLRIHKLIKD